MANHMNAFMAMLALGAAAVAADSSRSLLGSTGAISGADYKQCGGKGSSCPSGDPKCKDATWPGEEGMCREGFECRRNNAWYWGCTNNPAPPPGPTSEPTAERLFFSSEDYKQCGGKGGSCQGNQCVDYIWPGDGGKCTTGMDCMRKNAYYWGCTEKPTIASTMAPEPVAMPTDMPTNMPAEMPTDMPTDMPTEMPTDMPTDMPTEMPTDMPMDMPAEMPTDMPTEMPAAVPTPASTNAPTAVYDPADFKQCGGIGGECSGSTDDKCKDAAWPAEEGGSCTDGLTCYRVSKYHWQCDVEQPPQDEDSDTASPPTMPSMTDGPTYTMSPPMMPSPEAMPTYGMMPTMAMVPTYGAPPDEPAMGAPTDDGTPTASSDTPDAAAVPQIMYAASAFKQCGGSGGSCTGSTEAKCNDSRWPADEGGSCESGLDCFKISQYYWQCDTQQPPKDTSSPIFMPSDFKQCGGSGGECTGNDAAKCEDAQWPAAEGGSCKDGLACYRVNEYHWGCDVKQPM